MISTTLLVWLVTSIPALSQGEKTDYRRLSGAITIDGSSTVYPITEAVAEAFSKETRDRVRVTVGVSGTGGGFKRFLVGETDISNASRPIKDSEYKLSLEHKLEFIEIPVAYDGLTIVVNKANDWCQDISVEELRKIFLESSAVKTWRDVRAAWPDLKLGLYSPGTDSGTFDYFKEVVVGKEAMRQDLSVSEDDNVLVRGVAGDKGALGFFGCAYYFANQELLRAVDVVNPETKKPVRVDVAHIEDGSYAPFSRPLFLYVSKKATERPEVDAFVRFYLEQAPLLVGEVGYVRLPEELYRVASANFAARATGTQYLDKDLKAVSGPLPAVYRKK